MALGPEALENPWYRHIITVAKCNGEGRVREVTYVARKEGFGLRNFKGDMTTVIYYSLWQSICQMYGEW